MVAGPEPCVKTITLPDDILPVKFKTETDDYIVEFEENKDG